MSKAQDIIVSRHAAQPIAVVFNRQRVAIEGVDGWYAYRGVKGNKLRVVNDQCYPDALSALEGCGK